MHLVAKESNLDRQLHFLIFIGLEDVTKGLGEFRAFNRFNIGQRGQIDDRHINMIMNFFCCLDTIHLALEHDIHQN